MDNFSLEWVLADLMNVRDIGDFENQAVVFRYADGRTFGDRIENATCFPQTETGPARAELNLKKSGRILVTGVQGDCKAVYEQRAKSRWEEFPAIHIGNARRLLRDLNSERACVFDRIMPPQPETWKVDNQTHPELNRAHSSRVK